MQLVEISEQQKEMMQLHISDETAEGIKVSIAKDATLEELWKYLDERVDYYVLGVDVGMVRKYFQPRDQTVEKFLGEKLKLTMIQGAQKASFSTVEGLIRHVLKEERYEIDRHSGITSIAPWKPLFSISKSPPYKRYFDFYFAEDEFYAQMLKMYKISFDTRDYFYHEDSLLRLLRIIEENSGICREWTADIVPFFDKIRDMDDDAKCKAFLDFIVEFGYDTTTIGPMFVHMAFADPLKHLVDGSYSIADCTFVLYKKFLDAIGEEFRLNDSNVKDAWNTILNLIEKSNNSYAQYAMQDILNDVSKFFLERMFPDVLAHAMRIVNFVDNPSEPPSTTLPFEENDLAIRNVHDERKAAVDSNQFEAVRNVSNMIFLEFDKTSNITLLKKYSRVYVLYNAMIEIIKLWIGSGQTISCSIFHCIVDSKEKLSREESKRNADIIISADDPIIRTVIEQLLQTQEYYFSLRPEGYVLPPQTIISQLPICGENLLMDCTMYRKNPILNTVLVRDDSAKQSLPGLDIPFRIESGKNFRSYYIRDTITNFLIIDERVIPLLFFVDLEDIFSENQLAAMSIPPLSERLALACLDEGAVNK